MAPYNPTALTTLWWCARNPPTDPTVSFQDQTVLVTGANTGLGLEASVKFASLGTATLILGVRSKEKGDSTKGIIAQRAGVSPDIIHIELIDCLSFASVSDFASKISSKYGRLDVALLNAGIATPAFKLSEDGWESTLQVNVLSSVLLASLLLPKLKETAIATGKATHLEFTGSASCLIVKPATVQAISSATDVLKYATNKDNFDSMHHYALSKLLLLYANEGLARAVSGDNVAVVFTCPGLCKSDIGRDFPGGMKAFMAIFQTVFARSAEQGARSLVSGAALDVNASGKFWTNDEFCPLGDVLESAQGQKLQTKVWNEVVETLVKVDQRVKNAL